ncbi:OLC1v1000311C1 [Oldenlandia corymbosa var. corymbosa]|uniref:OLC1v1000311C1 n=1 Tax=Oldenlandia corymbosa var. corymbosa TaxID=529605 RepID=A0AAV1D629_OLDCO|nr:OLC1v1000311C1 [Oldenlandia corymbosa var. corymbosa]
MDKRLYDAAVQGDTASLYQLLEEDPDAIDKSYIICEDMNVLHISAMLGHEEFVKAILQINSPSSHRMCLARDREGKNPLQVAAINGKLEILNLVHHHDGLMQAAFEKAEEGGTILHLCVKYNQLEALKLLLQILTDPKLVGAKNKDGMTILHMAFEFNQNQRRQDIIIYLIENAAGIINLRNADGKTALDLFLEQAGIPSHDSIIFGRNKKLLLKLEGEGGIKDALSRSKAEIGEDAAISGPDPDMFGSFKKKKKHTHTQIPAAMTNSAVTSAVSQQTDLQSTEAMTTNSFPTPPSHPAIGLSNIKNYVTPILDFTNYMLWKEIFLPVFRGHAVIGHIDGSDPCPPSTLAASDDTSSSNPNPAFRTWTQIDSIVLSWIQATVSTEILQAIVRPNSSLTACDAWLTIEKLFHDQLGSRLLQLKFEFHSLKKWELTINEYVTKFKMLADSLTSVGSPIFNDDLVLQILAGLPSTYQSVSTTISHRVPLPNFVEARSMLFLHEVQLQHTTPSSLSTATTALVAASSTDLPQQQSNTPSQQQPSSNRGRGRGRGFQNNQGRGRGRGRNQIFGHDAAMEVIELLTSIEGTPLKTVSIPGMPGIGKTTLANLLYKHPSINFHFHVRAWCYASQSCVKEVLLFEMLNQIVGKTNKLRGRRYLIVIDDIWDAELWNDLKEIFPDDHNGSRILFTTRHHFVATAINSIPYALLLLSSKESCELLLLQVFGRGDCPVGLSMISNHITRNCRGLPLTVTLIAGILKRTTRRKDSWEQVAKTVFKLGAEKNYSESERQVLEGNIFYRHSSFYGYSNAPHTTYLHHHRPYGTTIYSLFNFKVSNGLSFKPRLEHTLGNMLRYKPRVGKGQLSQGTPAMRTRTTGIERFHYDMISKFLKFEVLDLGSVRVENSADTSDLVMISELVHLRYLEIRCRRNEIPWQIGSLTNLETLAISGVIGKIKLPESIWKLASLRNLVSDHGIFIFPVSFVELHSSDMNFPLLANLTSISTLPLQLGIQKLGRRVFSDSGENSTGCSILPGLAFLNELKSLKISFSGEVLSPCKFSSPPNLTKLAMSTSRLPWEELSVIGRLLPNLEVLKLLHRSFEGQQWDMGDGEFPKLKFLKLESLDIEAWNAFAPDHLPLLEQLVDSAKQIMEVQRDMSNVELTVTLCCPL